MNRVPTFSLCHTTARLPLGWVKAADAWFDACDHPENVEYILAVDHGQPEPSFHLRREVGFENKSLIVNYGRCCAVDGWNATARAANGRFLISVADDWTPCPHWDTQILKLIPNLDGEYVLDVNTGGDHGILTFSLLTRAYMNRLIKQYGYKGFFYPEYLGMMADAEFGEIARMDGVVIRAKHLLFPHDHPYYSGKPLDPIHQWQHRPEALKTGEEVFLRRMEFLSGVKIPRWVDQPGMPPLGELFGIHWEPGTLAQLCKDPQKAVREFSKRKERRYMSVEIEARTRHGWVRARIITQRANGTCRVETANHVEYEVTMQDIRALPAKVAVTIPAESSAPADEQPESAPADEQPESAMCGNSSAAQEQQTVNSGGR